MIAASSNVYSIPARPTAVVATTGAGRPPALRMASRSVSEPARLETFSPGQTIFFEGCEAESYFEIVSGTVRCCSLTEDGRRQIYRFAVEGEMLGLGGEQHYGYSAEAVTPVTMRRYRLSSLEAAMAEDQRLRERVVQALRDELAAVRTQMMLLGRLSAAERIVSFLRDLAARCTDQDGCIHLAMTRADIADYLGLTLETVSRKINMLKRLGVIELATPSRVRIMDFARLDEVAEAA